MNKANLFIFNLYHYLLNLRDTLQFTLPNEHPLEAFNMRKNVLENGIKEGSALGNFLNQNKEQGDKIREKLNEMLEDLYGDKSTVFMVNGESFRVDHTQHLKIYDYIVGLSESVRDIVYGYMNYIAQQNESDNNFNELMAIDEHLYRIMVPFFVLRDFTASFSEFQKVMGESKGKPTPQSNYIVQNEIMKYAGLIRFSRSHAHCTDNKTLDVLDEVNAIIEMCEGRRERRDNKSFKELFDGINAKLSEAFNEHLNAWNNKFRSVYDDYRASEAKRKEEEAAKAA